jgi:hypothetical protein
VRKYPKYVNEVGRTLNVNDESDEPTWITLNRIIVAFGMTEAYGEERKKHGEELRKLKDGTCLAWVLDSACPDQRGSVGVTGFGGARGRAAPSVV